MASEPTPAETAAETAATIKGTLRVLVVATLVLYLGLVAGGLWVWNNSNDNTDALCALRADLENRVVSSQQFLLEHPTGVGGITPAAIQTGIQNSQRTIKALSNLVC